MYDSGGWFHNDITCVLILTFASLILGRMHRVHSNTRCRSINARLLFPTSIFSRLIKINKTEIEIKGRRKLKQLRYKMIERSDGNRKDNNPKCKFYSLTHVSPTESAWSSFALIINKARFPRFRKTQSGKLKVLKPSISEEEKRLFSAANWKLSKVFTLPWKFMCTCTFMCPLNVHLFSEKSFPTPSHITW